MRVFEKGEMMAQEGGQYGTKRHGQEQEGTEW
jgi:hypothetical protein